MGVAQITFGKECKYINTIRNTQICGDGGAIFAAIVSSLILIFYIVFWVFLCGLDSVRAVQPNRELEIVPIQEPLPALEENKVRDDNPNLEKICEVPD